MGNEKSSLFDVFANETSDAGSSPSLDPTIPACLNDTVPYQKGRLPYYIGSCVFPLVFVIGVTGNLLNLIVLNSSGMRSKANHFLSAMAVVDLGFLVVMFVLTIAVYEVVAQSNGFLSFFFSTKVAFSALANALSSASIWFAVVVTVERLVAIRTPLRSRHFWKRWRICLIIGMIVFVSFSLQLYNFFWVTPLTVPNCLNDSRREHIFWVTKPRPDNLALYRYVSVSLLVSPLLQVTLPLVILVALNGMLLYHLRISRLSMARLGQSSNRTSDSKNEWKVTVTVLVIVATFLLFNCPSAIMFWLRTIGLPPKLAPHAANLTFCTNFLVVINKALNFILYCMSSAAFRHRLVMLFKKHADKSATWWQQSFAIGETNNTNLRDNKRLSSSYHTRNVAGVTDGKSQELETLMS